MKQKKMLIITYSVNEYEPDKMIEILSAINNKSNDDRSFNIVIDSEYEPINVFWNGDGCDKIWSITNGETTFESR